MARVTITKFGIQTGTDRTLFISWSWPKNLEKNTESYRVVWYYYTGDGVWFVGNDGKVDGWQHQTTYNPPSNATSVLVRILPISKTYQDKNKRTKSYFYANWSTDKRHNFVKQPVKPSAPSVKIENHKLTAVVDKLGDANATKVQFQIVKNDKTYFKTGTANIITEQASYSCMITAGSKYKVRCRTNRGGLYSDWSDYSANVDTIPAASKKIISIKALSETSVAIDWENVSNCDSYEIQYTTNKSYFDSSNEVQSHTVESVVGHAEITGLETGQRYFFRVRAVNSVGSSAWTPIDSIIIGKAPSAPTTWSSTTTVTTGEPLNLYWTHNSEDNSSETKAELELWINDVKETHIISKSSKEDEKDKTSVYPVDTSNYTEGASIRWRVRTKGILNAYGDWSIQRTIDIYAPAVLELKLTNSNGDLIETLEAFPFYISGSAGPNTQTPTGYNVTITANKSYTYIDQVGNTKIVSKGEPVYSKYFDTSDPLLIELSAGNIDLENNVDYTVTTIVSMNTGLTARSDSTFLVAWADEEYEPNAEIGIDENTLTASIRPYCEDEQGNLIDGITLSVYRREFDGTFTEIATGLDNMSNTYVTDPHPALDYARYRIVAISKTTGSVSYYDVPGYPVGEGSLVIQWDEEWSNFDGSPVDIRDVPAQPEWAGSMLKLPYNIDVSDSVQPEAELVKYIGRKYPVAYYGTQIASSSTWNAVIDKMDQETIYALRRLSIWKGDVYVREPSGTGYWANIKVSFSINHSDLTSPVTLNITRVEGGM